MSETERGELRVQGDADVTLIQVNDEQGKEIFRITPDCEMVVAEHVTPRDVAERLMEAWGGLVDERLAARLEGGEVVAWLVDCGTEGCEVEPSIEREWPPAPPKPPGKDGEWGYGEYECGACGVRWDDMIVTPLYRHPTDTEEE